MPVTEHHVSTYEEWGKLLEKLDGDDKPIYVILTGNKLENGESWCPDCNNAEPVIKNFLGKRIKKDIIVVRAELQRDYFKNPNCPFRKCNKIRLVRVPTMMYWNNIKRLEEHECANSELLEMFFEEVI